MGILFGFDLQGVGGKSGRGLLNMVMRVMPARVAVLDPERQGAEQQPEQGNKGGSPSKTREQTRASHDSDAAHARIMGG